MFLPDTDTVLIDLCTVSELSIFFPEFVKMSCLRSLLSAQEILFLEQSSNGASPI